MSQNPTNQPSRRGRPRRIIPFDAGYEAATSLNIPSVDTTMVISFLMNNADHYASEYRHKKTLDLAKSTYSDSAVGWVQVKENGDTSEVKMAITAQHRADQTYLVIIKINVRQEEILSGECNGCAASAGGCKHTMSAIFWLHRLTNQPASTDVVCYWRAAEFTRANLGQCKNPCDGSFTKIFHLYLTNRPHFKRRTIRPTY